MAVAEYAPQQAKGQKAPIQRLHIHLHSTLKKPVRAAGNSPKTLISLEK